MGTMILCKRCNNNYLGMKCPECQGIDDITTIWNKVLMLWYEEAITVVTKNYQFEGIDKINGTR